MSFQSTGLLMSVTNAGLRFACVSPEMTESPKSWAGNQEKQIDVEWHRAVNESSEHGKMGNIQMQEKEFVLLLLDAPQHHRRCVI